MSQSNTPWAPRTRTQEVVEKINLDASQKARFPCGKVVSIPSRSSIYRSWTKEMKKNQTQK